MNLPHGNGKEKRYVVLFLLLVAGFVLNIFAPRLFMGFNYLFGSIPVLLVLRLYGTGWGTLAGFIAGSWTYVLFGHPYAIVWLTAEPLCIGLALRFTPVRSNLVLLNTVYWPLVGIPLLWFFFKFIMGLPFVGTLPAALMFWVIGIANSLAATIILQLTPLARICGSDEKYSVVTMRMAVFSIMMSLVVYPAIVTMVLNGKAILKRNENHIVERLVEVAHHSMQSIDLLVEGPLLVLNSVRGGAISDDLIHNAKIAGLWMIDDNLHLSQHYLSTESPPGLNELELVLRHGNWAGVINNEIVLVGRDAGAVILLNRKHVDEHLSWLHGEKGSLWATLLDPNGNIIITSNPRFTAEKRYQPDELAESRPVGKGVQHVMPPMPSYITLWRRVQKSWYRYEPAASHLLGWKWVLELPFAPYQKMLLQQQTKSLQMLLLLCLSALAVSYTISRRFSSSILQLADITTDLAERVEKDQSLNWPETRLGEVETLSENFKNVSDTLRGKFRELRQSRDVMEETVASRTQELQAAKEQAEQVYRLMPSALFAVDRERRIIIWNKKAEQVTGYSAEEVIGKECSLFAMGECVKNCGFTSGEKVPAEGIERRIRNKQGAELIITKNIDFLRDGSGNIIGGIESFEDITEKLHLEEQLRQAQKMEAVGTLAGGIAHDFNNMLGGIMGGTEILSMYLPDDPVARQYHDMIMESANRAAGLTSKLLTFSRSSHKTSTAVDMHDVINDTLMLLTNTVDRRIRLETNLKAESSTVIGDPTQLQNVLLNLCINSSQAMPEGGTIFIDSTTLELDTVYCRNSAFELKPGEYLEIELRDTGEGIDPEIVDKIFDPFFTTKGTGEGTGLGLSSAYGTVKQHDGALTVYSELGTGTTFQLFLPLADKGETVKRETVDLKRGSGRILVVDDEKVMRVTARAILEDLGYSVVLAENGKEALALFQQDNERFDLVLLDMIMPVMNGKDCFVALRAVDPEVRVVLSSGFTREEELNEMKLGGLKGFIRKPYRGGMLSRVVYEALH